jgi:hypothetical protein
MQIDVSEHSNTLFKLNWNGYSMRQPVPLAEERGDRQGGKTK